MNHSDLDILLQEGEGSMLEYKETLSSSLSRELVAFANTVGGKIFSESGMTDQSEVSKTRMKPGHESRISHGTVTRR